MKKHILKSALLGMLFLITACSHAGVGVLTPWNQTTYIPAHSPTGRELYMQMDGLMTPTALNGQVRVNMPDGEAFDGEYAFLRTGKTNFGKIFGISYPIAGANDPRTIYIQAGENSIGSGSFGEISAFGNKGGFMRCEFFYHTVRNSPIGDGYGVCKTSTGDLYRLGFK